MHFITKRILGALLPPLVVSVFKSIRRGVSLLLSSQSRGYSDTDLVRFIQEKHAVLSKESNAGLVEMIDLRGIAGIGFTGMNKLSILDVGGSVGSHFYSATKVFPDINFDWTIIENSALVSELLRRKDLRFKIHDSISFNPFHFF